MGYLYAILAFCIWSISSTVVLRAVPLPGPAASDAGCLIGAAAVLLWMGPSRWPEVVAAWRNHGWRLLGLSAAFAGCAFTYPWAVKTTTVANAVLTHSLQPFLTCLLFVPLWGGARPTVKGWLALVIGMAGLAIVLGPQLSLEDPHLALGVTLGAISAAFFAWYNVQVPALQERLSPRVLHAAMILGAGALLSPAWLFAGSVTIDLRGAGAIVAFGLLNFAAANALFFKAMRLVPVCHVGTLAYFEPIMSITAAALWLGESATSGIFAGGALIFASGALVVYDRPRRS